MQKYRNQRESIGYLVQKYFLHCHPVKHVFIMLKYSLLCEYNQCIHLCYVFVSEHLIRLSSFCSIGLKKISRFVKCYTN